MSHRAQASLVFGLVAVELGLATPEQIARFADASPDLSLSLVEAGVLTPAQAEQIGGRISERLGDGGGDTAALLDTLGGDLALFETLAPAFGWTPEAPPSLEGAVAEDADRVTLEQPGRYRFEVGEGELGRGGIGRVLAAQDLHIGRTVAVKELLAGATDETGASTPRSAPLEERFVHEARVTGRLEHPSIVPVYELGRRPDGRLYYTMRLVRGRTLSKALRDADGLDGRLNLLGHFLDLCQAIAYAHSRQVVHRDIKPENVMIGSFGETVVLDWGLAKSLAEPEHTDVLGPEAAMFRQTGPTTRVGPRRRPAARADRARRRARRRYQHGRDRRASVARRARGGDRSAQRRRNLARHCRWRGTDRASRSAVGRATRGPSNPR